MRTKSSVFFSKLLGLIVLLLSLQSAISFADSVSTKTYRELTAIQELMSSSEDQTGNLKSAINRLEILLDNVSEESLDEALTLQTLGYALMADEQFEDYKKRVFESSQIESFIDMTAPAKPTSIDKALDDIAKEKYDLIAVGRALLSDYEWVVKMKEGRLNDVIPYTKDALLNLY